MRDTTHALLTERVLEPQEPQCQRGHEARGALRDVHAQPRPVGQPLQQAVLHLVVGQRRRGVHAPHDIACVLVGGHTHSTDA
jgi:hypothetical protein